MENIDSQPVQPVQNQPVVSPPASPKPAGSKKMTYVATAVILAVIAAAIVAAVLTRSPKNNQSSNQTSSWQVYQNKNLGFSFNYPTAWGTPKLTDTTPAGSPGHSYSMSFVKSAQGPHNQFTQTAAIFLETKDLVKGYCTSASASSCTTVSGFSAGAITPVLNQINSPQYAYVVKHDATSYAQVDNSDKKVSVLLDFQKVNLTTANVSAVTGKYSIVRGDNPKTTCPANQFSSANNCVSLANYNDLNKVLKSIQNS